MPTNPAHRTQDADYNWYVLAWVCLGTCDGRLRGGCALNSVADLVATRASFAPETTLHTGPPSKLTAQQPKKPVNAIARSVSALRPNLEDPIRNTLAP